MKTLTLAATLALAIGSVTALADSKQMCGSHDPTVLTQEKLSITYHSVDSHISGVTPIDVNVNVQAVTGYGCIDKSMGSSDKSQFTVYGDAGASSNWSINAQLAPSQGIFYGAIQAGKDTTTSVPVGGGPNGDKNIGVCYSTTGEKGSWKFIDKGMQTVQQVSGSNIDVYLAWAPNKQCDF